MKASSGSGLWPMRTSVMRAPRRASVSRGGCLRGEAQPEVARLDGAEYAGRAPGGFHLDPRAAELRLPVRIVGGDARQWDGGDVVLGPIDAGVSDFHRLDGPARGPDGGDAGQDLRDAEPVPRGVIEDEERLAVPGHLADVLGQRPVVELDTGQHDEPPIAQREVEPVVLGDAIVVVGDGEEVVPQRAIAGDHLFDGIVAVGERAMRVEIALEEWHYAGASIPR